MLTLKDYQKQTLVALEDYLTHARMLGPNEAFARFVAKNPTDVRPQTYRSRWGLDAVPYVCLRLPTGGGKTLLAAHAVSVATAYLERDTPFVLWLVPTNTIRKQTVEALQKPFHPYREALDAVFGMGNVVVCDSDDINNLRPTDVFDKTCIVVTTMQTLRVDDSNKDKRKVYGHNENFESHFKALPNLAPGLDRNDAGQVLYSFVNLLHQLRPLVIVDEAHKMISGLSGEVMHRINPACVIEFTATPVQSNVLYRVFPSALKAEEMVKLPFHLIEHPAWERAVLDALMTRKKLADAATADTDYIRPLVLFQAEKKGQTCTVDVLKAFLLENGVNEAEIAIATGEQRELDGINLFDKTCPVTCIITIEALKEGWDCSFAYVFCSVANIRSATDVEQLLGRVMRMPYARLRSDAQLNKAYAHVVAPTFGEAAAGMYDRMCNMGFGEDEAADNIIRQGLLPGLSAPFGNDEWEDMPLLRAGQPTQLPPPPPLVIALPKAPALDDLTPEDLAHVSVERQDGKVLLTCTGMLPHAVEERVLKSLKEADRPEIQRTMALHRQAVAAALPPSPSQRGISFTVPRLLVEVWGSLEWAEPETLLHGVDWSPLEFAGADIVRPEEFDYDAKAKTFIFDLEGEHMVYTQAEAQTQYSLFAMPETWTELRLARWLDQRCRQEDVSQTHMLEFCRRCVQSLLARGGLDLVTIYRAKDALAAVIKNKVSVLRKEAQKKGFQQLLFAPAARVEVSFTEPFCFPAGYAENMPLYTGGFRFTKHYYPLPRDLKSSGEEFRCAQAIDAHPAVETWVRNVDRQQGSFWLPTSTDKFYPDFVARLNDGRILVVEYKGQHLMSTDDTKEKQNIGELWASKSTGKALFAVVTESADANPVEKQLNIIMG